MANTIKIRRSATPGATPTTGQLALGELALNTYDGKLYTKKDNGSESIVELSGGGDGGQNYTYSSSAPVSPTAGDEWLDSDTGILYTYVNDGDSSAWVELGTNGGLGSNVDIPGTLDVTGATTLDSTLSFPLGSVSSPSIYPGTDTNTGLWSPAADTLAVSTGGQHRVSFSSFTEGTLVDIYPPDIDAERGSFLSLKGGVEGDSPGEYTTLNLFNFGNEITIGSFKEGDIPFADFKFRFDDDVVLRLTGTGRYMRLGSGTGGIQFNGDTASANALDDYEEGTWTPVVIGSTTAGTASYSFRNARYTKIGRLVQYEFTITWSSGTGTGNLRIDGLPFVCSGDDTYPTSAVYRLSNLGAPADSIIQGFVDEGTTQIGFGYSLVADGSGNYLAYSSSGSLTLCGTYSV